MRSSNLRASTRNILACIVFIFPLVSCKKEEPKNVKMEQMQKEIDRLSQENVELQREMKGLQDGLAEKSREIQTIQTNQKVVQTTSSKSEMTVERMRTEVRPLLKEVIKKIDAQSKTKKTTNQFGMRVQYDFGSAVYGLVERKDTKVPYMAKVIVSYEKYVESEDTSHSYGRGTSEFLFIYRNNRWSFLEYK